MKAKLLWAWYGILATLFGIGLAHLTAALTDPASSPVLAVGSGVIDLTPTPMKEWAIRTFGSADKVILVGSVMIGVLVLAAIAGVLARNRFKVGAGLLVILVLVAGFAVVQRPSFEVVDLLPTFVAIVAGPAGLYLLARAQHRSYTRTGDGSEASTTGRRTVLLTILGMSAVALAGGVIGRVVSSIKTRPENITLPKPVSPAPALPAGIDAQVPGITPFRTATNDFYRVDTRLDVPVVSAEDWTLTIDGDVDKEVTITFQDLLDMDMIERDITLTCVSNSVGGPYVGGARWLGVRLTDVLDLAGYKNTKADQLMATDFDGMKIGTPLELATDGRDAMVVVGMNGGPLPREHGFPVRIVVPGLYGFISATKWVTRLTLTTYAKDKSYWTDRDWATDAPIKISARIDTPRGLSEAKAGEVVIGGVAWAQQRGGVGKVQVQVDGGAWQDATLGPDGGNDYWRQWFLKADLSTGRRTIRARAVAGDGDEQIAARAEPFPAGSSGYHEIFFDVT